MVYGGATGNRTPIPWMQTTCSPVKLWPQARLQISDLRFQIEERQPELKPDALRRVQSEIYNLLSEMEGGPKWS